MTYEAKDRPRRLGVCDGEISFLMKRWERDFEPIRMKLDLLPLDKHFFFILKILYICI